MAPNNLNFSHAKGEVLAYLKKQKETKNPKAKHTTQKHHQTPMSKDIK